MAEYVPVLTKRERRFRNLGKVTFIFAVLLVVFFILSLKVSILDNDLRWEWLELKNNEGDKISGLLLTPDETPEDSLPAVIVVHDFAGQKEQMNRLSFELARHGFVVLALDLRDHGMSHGQTTYGDIRDGEPHDIIAAYDYLAKEAAHVDPERIALVGDGFGGAMCLMATNLLVEENRTVAATVAWGPPMDISKLMNSGSWDEVTAYLDWRIGDYSLENPEDRTNRSVVEHMDAANWSSDDVFVIYGRQDELIPSTQYDNLQLKLDLYEVTGEGHDLSENDKVLESTINFLYRELEHSPQRDIDFNYKEVESINTMVHFSTVAVMIFAFLTIYEALVMKKDTRSYIPTLSRDLKPLFVGMAFLIDIVVYVGIAWAMKGVYNNIQEGLFMDILPATQFYSTLLVAGVMFIAFAISVWYAWSNWMPRDEERIEETCGNLRGVASGAIAFLLVVINYIFGQILLFGPNYPKDVTFALVVALAFLFFVGHELWMRKLLYPKVHSLLSTMFLRRRWPYHLSIFLIMFALYALLSLVMLWNIGRAHFGESFGTVYGLFVGVIGFVSTVIYHRSKSILATVTYGTIVAPWLLSLAHHL